jgi:hypothetical protein
MGLLQSFSLLRAWQSEDYTRAEPGLAAQGLMLVVAAGLAVGLGSLFYRPAHVARFEGDARPRVRRAVAVSLVYVLAIGMLDVWFAEQGLGISLIPVIVLLALGLDVAAEVRAILAHGRIVAVWPEHRMYAVESARRALERVGIPSLARSAHQRVLWHFFAPFIPVQILVPEAREEEARAVLAAHFAPRTVDVDAVFS